MALMSALLCLLIITFLGVCSATTGLLQIKMSSHFNDQIQAFENAEAALLAGERSINVDQEEGDGEMGRDSKYQFHRLETKECGLFYQVDGTGRQFAASGHLQSIFKFPKAGKPCRGSSSVPYRVVWLQLNN